MLKKFSVASVFMLVGGASIAAPLAKENTTNQNNTSSSTTVNTVQEEVETPKPSTATGPIVTNQLTGKNIQLAYEREQARLKAEEEDRIAEEARKAEEAKKAQEAAAETARQQALIAQQNTQADAVNQNDRA